MSRAASTIRALIRDVPDFPKKGIVFKDITPVVGSPAGLRAAVSELAARYRAKKVTKVVGVEARGFIFGAALAHKLGVGFVPVRKPGKLPWKAVRETYSLEYGTDSLEMHVDAVRKGDRVVIVDDLLATGGTVNAAIKLVEQQGGSIVECAFLVELLFLNGREKLGHPVFSLIQF